MIFHRQLIRGTCLVLLGLSSSLLAQVHYHDDGNPWKQHAASGPDAAVPGWFYNLGITGLRAQLIADDPKVLLIQYVFPKSPVSEVIQIGDRITGVNGQPFVNAHRNGYGPKVFGGDGPIMEFGNALEASQSPTGKGRLPVTLRRGNETKEVILNVGMKYGTYAATYPTDCPKSKLILSELLAYLEKNQQKDGSFGSVPENTFAPLALLASDEARHLPAVERCVRYLATQTPGTDLKAMDLTNWKYLGAAIVLSEYYLKTHQAWVLQDLQRIHGFLAASQYLDMAQIDPKAKITHPRSFPKGPADSYGGWGQNPGFEGYGPIAAITAQGALAYALMFRCGIPINREHHDAAYHFLEKATGPNGYVWYKDEINGGPEGWADMGRTGTTAIANQLSPYPEPVYRERALLTAKQIGEHPQSFPDTHGCPLMGMAYSALGANIIPEAFRHLMDANRWWFTLAQCTDGSFYYQPNRDNAGYGPDARMKASASVAFILSIPKRSLVLTGAKLSVIPLPASQLAPAKN